MENIERIARDAIGLVGAYVPSLVAALVVLVVGWIVASIIARLVQKAVSLTGLGTIVQKGMPEPAAESTAKIERWIGRGVFLVLMLFVLVAFFEVLGLTQITGPLTGFLNELFVYAPRLIGPLLLIVIAWVVANLLRAITRRALTAVRLDERLAASAELAATDSKPFSETVSESVYWLTYLLFLPAVLSALDLGGLLEPVRAAVSEILAFLPNILAAAIILIVGWLVARVLRRITTNFLMAAGAERLRERDEVKESFGRQTISGTAGLIVYVLVFVPVLIAALNALNLNAVTEPASDMLRDILSLVPNLVAGVFILLIAFFVGRIVAGLATGVLTGIGFNNVSQTLGISHERLAGERSMSEIVGYIIYIAIMMFATIEALNLIGFEALSGLILAFLIFAINALFGLVIIGLGLFLGKLAGDVVATTNVPSPRTVSWIARVAIIVLAVAMGVRQMGVAEEIISLAFGLTLGAIAVAAAIAFGFGGRDAAARLIEEKVEQKKLD